MAAVHDENTCPNQASTTRRSSTKAASSFSSAKIKKSNKHKICNSNVSPIKRQTNVAKLAALYDYNNNGTSTIQYKQHPLRVPVSSAAGVHRPKSKAVIANRSAFDNKRDDGGSKLQNNRLQDKLPETILKQTISESNSEVLDRANDDDDAKENELLKVDEQEYKAPQQDAVAKQSVTSTTATAKPCLEQDKATPSCSAIKANDTSSSLLEDTNTTSQQQQLPPAIKYISQAILLILSIYEVQHYYHLIPTSVVFEMTGWCQHYHNSTSTTAATITDAVSNWSEVLHVGFVLSFYVRALMVSAMITKQSMTKKEKRNGKVSLYTALIFLFIAICWVTILPIFRDDCGSKACFFMERNEDTHHMFKVSSPRYSILDLLITKWYKSIRLLIRIKIKSRVRKEVQRALLSPFGIHGRLKKLFTIIRWSKFLAPLIGTCNKFRGHILDMIQKRRQHNTSKAAQQRWDVVLDALSKQSKLERAVLKIQKCFREKREQKAKRRYELMKPTVRETPGKHQMGNQIRERIRERLIEEQRLSRFKLEQMEKLNSERQMRRQVSQDERREITKHKESERKLKKRLLLSPNTSFAVAWKYITVTCVALEISQFIFAPILSGGELKKMELDTFILKVLKVSSSSHILATAMVPVVTAIFFLDVFITFFTGDLASSTGTLIPKPFFTRYVVPGIALQLVVNPTMIEISQMVKQMMIHAIHIGPSLCFHLLLAIVPFATLFYDLLLDLIFDFVDSQNLNLLKK